MAHDIGHSEYDTREAWERFVSSGNPAEERPAKVRKEILESWRRSHELGVNAGSRASRKIIDEDKIARRRKRNAVLRRAASAAFRRLAPHLEEARTILLLADDQGVIIDAIGDGHVLDEGQQIHLEIGGDWREETIGTNGIGTALRTGKPAYVHATEHFVEGVQSWTCTGAPIRDPLTHQTIGVVDLSGPPQIFRQHNIALVLATAREIEAALAKESQAERTQLLEAFLMSDHGRAHDSVVLLDRTGRVLFRRGLEEKVLRTARELEIGHKLLPKLDGLSDTDIPKLMPVDIETKGIERLKLDGEFRGAAVFLQNKGVRHGTSAAAYRIKPRANVPEGEIQIVGTSPKMVEAIGLAKRSAMANVSVLLHGETGVGKELFARLIHSLLPKSGAPYVPINCAAMSSDLAGAELFGYAEGAFTGAARGGRMGKFEQADNGVLCLDEIGDMPMELQPYLLRVLEQRAIYRIGDSKRRPVNVRLIAMTNRDLRKEVDKGTFRRDLFYRIGVMTIEVPPLRERGDDVLALLAHFSDLYAEETGQPRITFTEEATEKLTNYPWPGNVRELRNLVQRLYLVKSDNVVTQQDLPLEIQDGLDSDARIDPDPLPGGFADDLESIEASAIRRAIIAENGNLTRVAAVLGISRPTLYRKVKRYRIPKA